MARQIEELNHPPKPRRLDLAGRWRRFRRDARWRWQWRRTRHWPQQLTPGFPFEWMGNSDDARRKLGELPDGLDEFDEDTFASMQPPTEADVLLCRKKLRRVRNPVGFVLAEYLTPTDASQFVFRYRAASREAQRDARRSIRGVGRHCRRGDARPG